MRLTTYASSAVLRDRMLGLPLVTRRRIDTFSAVLSLVALSSKIVRNNRGSPTTVKVLPAVHRTRNTGPYCVIRSFSKTWKVPWCTAAKSSAWDVGTKIGSLLARARQRNTHNNVTTATATAVPTAYFQSPSGDIHSVAMARIIVSIIALCVFSCRATCP